MLEKNRMTISYQWPRSPDKKCIKKIKIIKKSTSSFGALVDGTFLSIRAVRVFETAPTLTTLCREVVVVVYVRHGADGDNKKNLRPPELFSIRPRTYEECENLHDLTDSIRTPLLLPLFLQ